MEAKVKVAKIEGDSDLVLGEVVPPVPHLVTIYKMHHD